MSSISERARTPAQSKVQRTSGPPRRLLQRTCACGNHTQGGQCTQCARNGIPTATPPAAISNSPLPTLDSGERLDAGVRSGMESHFGRSFEHVRVHADSRAADSAQRLNAAAYTTGRHIVFGAGRFNPRTPAGSRLLAHELTHVVQQEQSSLPPWTPGLEPLSGGGHRVTALPPLGESGDRFEWQADAIAARTGVASSAAAARPIVAHTAQPVLQRVELPKPLPICGANVTDIDVLPARPRPLVECGLPPTLMVTRINVVGRQRTPASTGRGRIIFNLHIGYYRDPATGRLCAVASDSKLCLTPGGCIHLGCFPTLREILDAIYEFLKKLLKAIGIIILAIILFLILRGLRGAPGGGPGPVPAFAGREEAEEETTEA